MLVDDAAEDRQADYHLLMVNDPSYFSPTVQCMDGWMDGWQSWLRARLAVYQWWYHLTVSPRSMEYSGQWFVLPP